MSKIKLLHSTTSTAVPSSLDIGELAINHADKQLYIRDGGGNVVSLLPDMNDYALKNHNHDARYLRLDPDNSNSSSISYFDTNPSVNGISYGGGFRFGANGNLDTGLVVAKGFNARSGKINSKLGYYVGDADDAINGGTFNTTIIADGQGALYNKGVLVENKFISNDGASPHVIEIQLDTNTKQVLFITDDHHTWYVDTSNTT